MTLTDFLLARIGEDEAAARDVHHRDCRIFVQLTIADCSCDLPARVLAECEAKRLLIERVGNPDWAGFSILALPYAEHPDYRQEWKP